MLRIAKQTPLSITPIFMMVKTFEGLLFKVYTIMMSTKQVDPRMRQMFQTVAPK